MTPQDFRDIYSDLSLVSGADHLESLKDIKCAQRVLKKLFPKDDSRCGDEKTFKIDAFIALYYLHRCRNCISDKVITNKINDLSNSLYTSFVSLEAAAQFCLDNETEGNFKRHKNFILKDFGFYASVQSCYLLADEDPKAAMVFFQKDNRINKYFTDRQLMHLYIKHQKNKQFLLNMTRHLHHRGKNIKQMAIDHLHTARILFKDPSRITLNLPAKAVAEIIEANLDKLTRLVTGVKKKRSFTISHHQIPHLYALIHQIILKGSSYPLLDNLLYDKDAISIISSRQRLKCCFLHEVKLLEIVKNKTAEEKINFVSKQTERQAGLVVPAHEKVEAKAQRASMRI